MLAIFAAALAVETPFLFRGTPSGHDFEFHLYTWLEALSQWKQGIVYPRWAALAHFAYGEPRFLFYPPASWSIGAALSAVFPWTSVSPIYIWLALVAAGLSMFLLVRPWFDRGDATFAAVLYAVNPYHLVIVYWRSAFAELLASSLLPLLLLLVLRAEKKNRPIIFLSLLLACAWLVNAPAAVMVHYSLALLVGVLAWQRRSPRMVLWATAAVISGAALAAFYLLPAIYEQRWVNIAEAVSAGSRPQDNFLFAHTGDIEHDAFNHVISWVATTEIIFTMVAAGAARGWRKRNRELWSLLLAWAAGCAFLMVGISALLWNVLPKLRFMQFPWRWTLCLGVPFTLFLVMATRRWTSRVAIYVATLFVVAFAWQHFQAPWWDTAADLREMQDNMASGVGYEGTEEYTPLGGTDSSATEPGSVDKDARRITVVGAVHAAIHVLLWKPEHRLFTAKMSAADQLRLRLFNYPAWHVEVNGQPAPVQARENTGEMMVPVGAGANRVEITFIPTWDRKAGGWVSGLAVLSAILLLGRTSLKKYL